MDEMLRDPGMTENELEVEKSVEDIMQAFYEEVKASGEEQSEKELEETREFVKILINQARLDRGE